MGSVTKDRHATPLKGFLERHGDDDTETFAQTVNNYIKNNRKKVYTEQWIHLWVIFNEESLFCAATRVAGFIIIPRDLNTVFEAE